MCISVQNFIQIGQTVGEIYTFFSRWLPSAILDLWGKV